MCGFTGLADWSNQDVERTLLTRMVEKLHHRGPDGRGFFTAPGIGLAHARLSIIDLQSGQQPIHNERRTVQVVFNGEIFNYIELRQSLKEKGHQFYTQSDTEVIVHLYEEYGTDFPTHLNGQFAIALWDTERRQLLLTRDRAGICPLFYATAGEKLLFGSEIKAILASGKVTARLDPRGLDELFTFWYALPPRTLFEGVSTVLPGEVLIFSADRPMQRHQYWHWQFAPPGQYLNGSSDALADELKSLLIDSVRLRLRADVPVGCYLSGGLDSSAIAAMVRFHTDTPLRTFSIGFEDPGLDESSYQQEMARHLGTDHSSLACKRTDIAQQFLATIEQTESPILRAAPVPMGMLSGLVHQQGYKVVLTGEGADEVLGGYDIFKEGKIREFWGRQPQSQWRPLILKRLYPYLNLPKGRAAAYLKNFFGSGLDNLDAAWFAHLPRWTTTARCKEFFSDQLRERLHCDAVETMAQTLPDHLQGSARFNQWQYVEARGLMSAYLLSSQGDRMLMRNSVEGRFPYLDHRVIEFAGRLPPRFKMRVLREKYLLKKAVRELVPLAVIDRHKQPYRAPDIPAFFEPTEAPFVKALMSDHALRESGYFDPKKVSLLMKKIRLGRAIGAKDNMAFLGILSTQAWHNLFID